MRAFEASLYADWPAARWDRSSMSPKLSSRPHPCATPSRCSAREVNNISLHKRVNDINQFTLGKRKVTFHPCPSQPRRLCIPCSQASCVTLSAAPALRFTRY